MVEFAVLCGVTYGLETTLLRSPVFPMAIRVNVVAKEEDGYIQACGRRSGVDHVAMEDWNGGYDMPHR